jgi:hypothetical protein
VYAQNNNRLYINLFVGSKASFGFNGGNLEIIQKTEYPWKGTVDFILNPTKRQAFELAVRIPGWAQNQPIPGDLYSFESAAKSGFTITLNGKPALWTMDNGYAIVKSEWKKGDVLSLELPMPVQRIKAHEKIVADNGKVALQRGPIVYCAEWPDNTNGHVLNLILDKNASLQPVFHPDKLNGITVVSSKATSIKRTTDGKLEETSVPFTAIPYFAWANRGVGEMAVWFATQASKARPLPAPTVASNSKVTASYKTKALIAVNDQMLPQSSNDGSVFYYHWWPKKDTLHWIQYTFEKTSKVSKAKVYWFDDGPWGGCRVPESWKLMYLAPDGTWTDVAPTSSFGTEKDKLNEVTYIPVETTALRLIVKLPKDNSSGIYEWVVE